MITPTSRSFIFSAATRLLACAAVAVCFSAVTAFAKSSAGPLSPAFDAKGYAAVLHVDQVTGNDFTGDGSRAKPWASLSHAYEQVAAPAKGKLVAILVAQGRYEQPTFVLKSGVDLYGGFAAITQDNAVLVRDVIAYPTILDGAETQRIVIGADGARLDGFHLVNGRIRGKGAALLCDGTSPVIANCVFRNNRTLAPRPWNPPFLHETANDGGAVMCVNGAAPRIEQCLFIDNDTECGRGGAIACDLRAKPVIVRNVFAHNRAGLDDPLRSSDGGAVTFFDWSAGEFSENIVVANVALASNDAGGLWIAMWSAPLVKDNILVANYGDDDAGGLFIGGQEHRYGVPLDAYPAAKDFNVVVTGNLIVGNANKSKNSGAFRITMESRVDFSRNIITANVGGAYFQRSEIKMRENTIWQEWQFVEDKAYLAPSSIENNILLAQQGQVDARVTFRNNQMDAAGLSSAAARSGSSGNTLVPTDPEALFVADGVAGNIADMKYDPATFTTRVTVTKPLAVGDYSGRPMRIGDNPKGGNWRVIKQVSGTEIIVWGRMEPVTKTPKYFEVLRTFTLKK